MAGIVAEYLVNCISCEQKFLDKIKKTLNRSYGIKSMVAFVLVFNLSSHWIKNLLVILLY